MTPQGKENVIKLCKCNNCDAVLIDKNPQVDTKEYTLSGNELSMVNCVLGGDLIPFWGCPNCLTDEYLTAI